MSDLDKMEWFGYGGAKFPQEKTEERALPLRVVIEKALERDFKEDFQRIVERNISRISEEGKRVLSILLESGILKEKEYLGEEYKYPWQFIREAYRSSFGKELDYDEEKAIESELIGLRVIDYYSYSTRKHYLERWYFPSYAKPVFLNLQK
jgi:hypothetical protein